MGLLFELLLPSILILLLSIPKIFLDPIQFPQNVVPGENIVESVDWVTAGEQLFFQQSEAQEGFCRGRALLFPLVFFVVRL